MQKLLQSVKAAYPALEFIQGDAFSWSPKDRTVTYAHRGSDETPAEWSLLHELAHALLDHQTYETDFELLLLEATAWHKAKALGVEYDIAIDEEHIQDCLDTYRDWLYQRSCCPSCTNTSLQQDAVTYKCFNCGASWTVTSSRFCRPYRLSSKALKVPRTASPAVATTFL